MSGKNPKIHLVHGESDYLVFKNLKDLKTDLGNKNINISQFFGSSNLTFDEIFSALHSSDLFMSESAVVIRDLLDKRSFYPFVEDLLNYLETTEEIPNTLYLFHYGKIAKNTKIYKAIDKKGNVIEHNTPDIKDIKKVISQSVNITDDAAELLIHYANFNLFQIRNEVKKLKAYLDARKKDKVDVEDVEEICLKNFSQDEIWGIGSKFLNYFLTKDEKIKSKLIDEVEDLLVINTPAMQILYSFYQYALSAIKMRMLLDEGKGYKECMSAGYFFVKEFFNHKDKMKLDELMKLNSLILDVEFGIKNGSFDETTGIRYLLAKL